MKRIIVTGCGGPASIGVTRSLKKAGNYYLAGTDCNIFTLPFAETDSKHLVPKAADPDYIDSLNRIIEKEKIDFLHAQPDSEVPEISKNRNKLKAKTFLPDHKTIEICQDKYKSFLLWQKSGIQQPNTILLKNETDLKAAFELLPKPFWIRAIKGAGGKGSLIVKDFNQAKIWIDYWNGWGSFIASELLPKKLVTWQSIWKDGELICAQGRERLSWAMGSSTVSGVSGMTGVAKTIARKDLDEIAEKSIFAIDKKPNGIFSVDLKENSSGVPCPTEINIGRFFTTIQFFAELGLNMPDIYIKTAFGERVEVKKYNPLPPEHYWLRSADCKPLLATKKDMQKIGGQDIEKLLMPDSTVIYNV